MVLNAGALEVTNNGNNTFKIACTDGTQTPEGNTAVIPFGANYDTATVVENPVTSIYDSNVANAPGSWPLSALDQAEGALSAGVRIAVIDTGISTKAIAPEHLADGKNYIVPDSGTEDRLSHGTAIAGILVGSDKKGIKGVAPAATLVPLVYYTSDGDSVIKGDSKLLARIIRDAVDVYGCRVINISSGTTDNNGELKAAVAYAEEHGALVVSSVGNDNNEYPNRLYYPAAYDTVLGVAALRQDGEIASFSQRNASVALCAPGDDLQVLRKGGTTIKAFGTSFAAAYVSGAAAVLLAEHPELTPSQVRRILCASALDIGKPGYDIESGWGAVQIGASLEWAEVGQRVRHVTAENCYFEAVR
jgi:subtilisin family serine protease